MIRNWKNILFAFVILLIFAELDEVFANPRCGTTDEMMIGRSKRFVLHGISWASKNITYRITKYTKQLSKQKVDNALRNAFNKWSDYTQLKFTQLGPKEDADIDIRFEKGDHNDNHPFDGPGNELAHGFYGGDLHFDDDEKWSETGDEKNSYSLYTVAIHEIGHSLGLRHSEIRKSLMAPYYNSGNKKGDLHQDDINGIQEIYGKKKNHIDLNLCVDPVIDTIFTTFDGKFYVFKKDHYYELKGKSLVDGPKLINETWVGLPSQIEAAFFYQPTNKTYFFKDSSYWRFSHTKMDDKYPRLIPHYLPGLPSHVDDAMVWNVDEKVYFFKGTKFYRVENLFSENFNISVTKGDISSTWKKIPKHIDAVFTNTDNITYFFKDDIFYSYAQIENQNKFEAKSYLTIDEWYNCINPDSDFTKWWKSLKRQFKDVFSLE